MRSTRPPMTRRCGIRPAPHRAGRSGHAACSARLACIARTRLRRSACGTSSRRSSPTRAIEDWLDTMTSRGYWENRPGFADAMRGGGQTLRFHATDSPAEWVVRRESNMVVLERTHTKADVAVRGPATELPLVISRRRPLDAAPTLELHGDRALFRPLDRTHGPGHRRLTRAWAQPRASYLDSRCCQATPSSPYEPRRTPGLLLLMSPLAASAATAIEYGLIAA